MPVHDCDSTAPLKASHAHYEYHRLAGEPACDRSLKESRLGWRKRVAALTPKGWQVYVLRFENGIWYYGSTSRPLWRRGHKFNTHRSVKALVDAGVDFTAEVLAVCDTKEQARQMEARLILSSDRRRLLNEDLPWHFCNIFTEGQGAYKWHRRRGTAPCPNALRARNEATRKGR